MELSTNKISTSGQVFHMEEKGTTTLPGFEDKEDPHPQFTVDDEPDADAKSESTVASDQTSDIKDSSESKEGEADILTSVSPHNGRTTRIGTALKKNLLDKFKKDKEANQSSIENLYHQYQQEATAQDFSEESKLNFLYHAGSFLFSYTIKTTFRKRHCRKTYRSIYCCKSSC